MIAWPARRSGVSTIAGARAFEIKVARFETQSAVCLDLAHPETIS